jgi:CheY-like chemotaxis protein
VAGLAAFHQATAQELANRQEQLTALQEKHAGMTQELAARQQQLKVLQSRHEGLTAELAARLEQLKVLQGKLDGATQELANRQDQLKVLQAKSEAETRKLNDRLAKLTADNEELQGYQLQWAMEREEQLKARQAAEARHIELNQSLQSAQEEHETLKALHGQVTEQAQKLASEWSSRREAMSAEGERLRHDLEQARNTVQVLAQREKQWQGQVFKLQDELRALRDTAGRMTITDEQSHDLLSQLNSIIGFAEILLDESGNRATAEEREEFLRDIKDSGTHLADYLHRLKAAPEDEGAGPEPSVGSPESPVAHWTARAVLVVTTDGTVGERTQAFLSKAGYHVVFATDPDEALGIAVQQQPLAIVVDSDLPENGLQRVTDALQRDARTRDIPVALTVSNAGQPLGLTIDRFDLLTKPLNRQQMLQMMTKYDLLADRRRATNMPTSVLVIDDDPRNTRLVKAMLKPHAISVLEADGGAAGIKLALKAKPDVIILDLMMPDVDGFQVVSELRGNPATSQIPILIYTAKTVTADDRKRLKHDIQAIARKGELTKDDFLGLVYKRGERRNRPPAGDAAA